VWAAKSARIVFKMDARSCLPGRDVRRDNGGVISRREAVRLLGSASAAAWFASAISSIASDAVAAKVNSPRLAPGDPKSPERIALIEAFKQGSEGLEKKFEARTHKGDFMMPYRLFRPDVARKLPLVIYLSGSGGQGDDNLKQLGLGNIFGTHVESVGEPSSLFRCSGDLLRKYYAR
jgi:hypothetical protein